MSRLIDADKLIDSMDDRYKEKVNNVPDILAEGFMQMEILIKEQPTAFDLDKVVEQLENLKKIAEIMRNIDIEHNAYIEEAYERGRIYVLNEAIEIVKAGERDES